MINDLVNGKLRCHICNSLIKEWIKANGIVYYTYSSGGVVHCQFSVQNYRELYYCAFLYILPDSYKDNIGKISFTRTRYGHSDGMSMNCKIYKDIHSLSHVCEPFTSTILDNDTLNKFIPIEDNRVQVNKLYKMMMDLSIL